MTLQDVIVTINIANPAPRIGLGRPLILVQNVAGSTYTEFSTLDALAAKYPEGTEVHEKAEVIFEQTNRPDVVAVGTYASDITTTLTQFYYNPWHFALIAGDSAVDQAAATTFIDNKDFKFVAVQVKDDAGREAVKGKRRTIVFDHPTLGEHLDAAAIGELGSLPVGSITWKFKGLKGITPRYLNETELAAIEVDNAIAYVMKSGKAQLSEGTFADGEYIDVLHGQDWIKADMENEIQYALQRADKLPYDQRGISVIEASASTTLKRGFNNGLIALNVDGLPDYNIYALTREQSDIQDRADRIYRGLSFDFSNAGAIHDVRVKGSINI